MSHELLISELDAPLIAVLVLVGAVVLAGAGVGFAFGLIRALSLIIRRMQRS